MVVPPFELFDFEVLSIRSRKEIPVPGIPKFEYVPLEPMLKDAPRCPSDNPTPDFETFKYKPLQILILL